MREYFYAYTFLFIILLILIIFSLCGLYQQPPEKSLINITTKSIVTNTNLGARGDMGNQIFQIACLLGCGDVDIILPQRLKTLPIYELFDISMLKYENIIPDETFYERNNYEKINVPDDGKVYNIRGYRQCYKYFDSIKPTIQKLFTPKKSILDSVKRVLPEKYIAIHIRRGDYIKTIHKIPLLREFKRCELNYYQKSLNDLLTTGNYNDYSILICTDSPKLVMPLLPLIHPRAQLAPIATNISPKFNDFCVLYSANAVIMSNSTYSWMASYLSPQDRTIICPSPWWDPSGFIGTSMGLSGPYLHYPGWILRNPTTGDPEAVPLESDESTFEIFKTIRGFTT